MPTGEFAKMVESITPSQTELNSENETVAVQNTVRSEQKSPKKRKANAGALNARMKAKLVVNMKDQERYTLSVNKESTSRTNARDAEDCSKTSTDSSFMPKIIGELLTHSKGYLFYFLCQQLISVKAQV